MGVTLEMANILEGWPVRTGPIASGPGCIDSDGDGRDDRILWTDTQGNIWLYRFDGDVAGAIDADARSAPLQGDLVGGPADELFWGSDDGSLHLTNAQGEEAPGWPVELGSWGATSEILLSPQLQAIVCGTDRNNVLMIGPEGEIMEGWPVALDAPVLGLAVFPSGDPAISVVSGDGRMYLFDLDGALRDGWPVITGAEPLSGQFCADYDRDGEPECVVVADRSVHLIEWDGSTGQGFPVELEQGLSPTGSPVASDLDSDGFLEIFMETRSGVVALEASGATLADWPSVFDVDSLCTADHDRRSEPVGGAGLGLSYLRDGRILLWESGRQATGFPLSVGDDPPGRALLLDIDQDGELELFATDPSGFVGGWHTGVSVTGGWLSCSDGGNQGCWWPDDLPPTGGGQIAGDGVIEEGSLFVYPNPARDGEARVRFIPVDDSEYAVSIFNMAGELVARSRGCCPGSLPVEVEWSTEDLSPGVYFVTVEVETSDGRVGTELFHAAVIN